MRVIAGKARRTILKTPDGLDTRPTTDRIKETLFNILNYELIDKNFLDLFSGSGGIGIEALSRGANTAYFVENNRSAIDCIEHNLEVTKLNDVGHILKLDVSRAIKELGDRGIIFDIIFMDPPYNNLYEKQVLEILNESSIITEDTLIVIEASLETDFSYLNCLGYRVLREKLYKTNKHIFIKYNGE